MQGLLPAGALGFYFRSWPFLPYIAILDCIGIYRQVLLSTFTEIHNSTFYRTLQFHFYGARKAIVIAIDKTAIIMPQGQYRRPRINFGISEESKEQLEQWAKDEHRTVSNLVEAITEEALKTKRIGGNQSPITIDDLDQIKKFIALLLGDRERNGVSFVLLGQALGFDPEKLHELYQLVQQCKAEKKPERRTNK
jgi:hypothetical protein